MEKSVNLDGNVYHNEHAKCNDCSCQITLANFTVTDQGDAGKLLLCKTHYEARLKKGEGFGDESKFQGKTKETTGKLAGSALTKLGSSASCKICSKSLYPNDAQFNVDGTFVHKTCAKCADCDTQITLTNMAYINTPNEFLLLCKTHYTKRIHESGGSYPGGDKFNVKNTRDLRAADVTSAAKAPIRADSVQKDVMSRSSASEIVQE